MIKIENNANQLIIVLHEIYGINAHITGVCEAFAAEGFDVICPNLLNRDKPFSYIEEEKAYRNFMDHVGFNDAFKQVKMILRDVKDKYAKIYIVGFSVGATVAWLCTEENVDGVVGYYGSRIRDFRDVSPQCPVLLFFPEEEESFNVDVLILSLDGPYTDIRLCQGEHGFTNPYTPNYDATLVDRTMQRTLDFLRKLKAQTSS